MAIKAAGEHKQRILVCVALDGLRLRDERTGVSVFLSFVLSFFWSARRRGLFFDSKRATRGSPFYPASPEGSQ